MIVELTNQPLLPFPRHYQPLIVILKAINHFKTICKTWLLPRFTRPWWSSVLSTIYQQWWLINHDVDPSDLSTTSMNIIHVIHHLSIFINHCDTMINNYNHFVDDHYNDDLNHQPLEIIEQPMQLRLVASYLCWKATGELLLKLHFAAVANHYAVGGLNK